MTQAKRQLQVSLLVDLRGTTAFRAATYRSALAVRQNSARSGISVQLLVCANEEDRAGQGLLRGLLESSPPDGWLDGTGREEWHAVASGEYITVLEAPGFVTSNWVLEALASHSRSDSREVAVPEAVLFPEHTLGKNLVWRPGEGNVSARAAFASNPFGTLFLAHRDVFQRIPLRNQEFAQECWSWSWHCDALEEGMSYRRIGGTLHVVRTREAATASGCLGASRKSLPRYSKLFLQKSRPLPRLNFVPATPDGLPEGLIEEIDRLAPDLKPALLFSDWAPACVDDDALEMTDHFFEMLGQLPEKVDFLVVHHVLSVGGSEKETLLSLEVIRRLRPEISFAVITTDERESPWAHRVPGGTPVIELGLRCARLPEEAREILLFRLLLQKAPRVINNVISTLCWNVFENFSEALARRSNLIATEFCINVGTLGNLESFAYSHLPQCWQNIECLLVDNAHLQQHLEAAFGFDRIRVIAYPPSVPLREPRRRKPGAMKLVWAGRFSRQKRLDILVQIALRAFGHEFHVFGTTPDCEETARWVDKLSRLPNVVMRPSFERFDEIASENFAALVYTSSWDGTPNVILEAIASGIPVIAPAIGGIPEVLNQEAGYLVSDPEAVLEYLEGIRSIQMDPDAAFRKVLSAQRAFASIRSDDAFSSSWSQILEQLLGRPALPEPLIRTAPLPDLSGLSKA